MFISALINVESFKDETGILNQLSIMAAYATIFLLVTIPLQMTFSLIEDYRRLAVNELKEEYPILLEEVPANRLSAVLYYPLFFLR